MTSPLIEKALAGIPSTPPPYSPADSRAFFAAMNQAIDVSRQLHPVNGRNCDLVGTWRKLESGLGELTFLLMSSVRRTFEQNVDLVRDTIVSDPLWQMSYANNGDAANQFDHTIAQVTAPLMFWTRPNAIIEPTGALEKMPIASDLGDDLPADVFRPPFPATYIRFGETFQQAAIPGDPHKDKDAQPIQGVYVFEAVREKSRALTLVTIIVVRDQPTYSTTTLELIIQDESRSLSELVREGCERPLGRVGGLRAHYESVLQIVVKVFLYMSMAQTAQIEEHDYTAMRERLSRIGLKKAAKLQRQLPNLYDRIVLGPQEIPAHGHGELSPHLRRGHFTMQPHGPRNSLRKLMFIAPTWVRADKLAASSNAR
jgi:hypothetical protein